MRDCYQNSLPHVSILEACLTSSQLQFREVLEYDSQQLVDHSDDEGDTDGDQPNDSELCADDRRFQVAVSCTRFPNQALLVLGFYIQLVSEGLRRVAWSSKCIRS